jgi:hypothetical protein
MVMVSLEDQDIITIDGNNINGLLLSAGIIWIEINLSNKIVLGPYLFIWRF